MSWRDRDYNRVGGVGPQDGFGRALGWVLNGRVPLYEALGIRVALHSTFVIFVALELLLNWRAGLELGDKVAYLTMLFGIVLLHEYGHCLMARRVGGSAEDILMWPLGGLAFTSPPRRPWPTFLTVAAGPGVNVLICAATALALAFTLGRADLGWGNLFNPFEFVLPAGVGYDGPTFWLWYAFKVSYYLLLFNLLPIYPLDGGQIVQTAIWARAGYYKSMVGSTLAGQFGCGALALAGLYAGNLWLIVIGVMFFINNRRMYQQVKAAGPWAFGEEDEPDWKSSLATDPEEPEREGFRQRVARRRAERREAGEAEAAERLERDVDAVLAKISRTGMASLTASERRTLERGRQAKSRV